MIGEPRHGHRREPPWRRAGYAFGAAGEWLLAHPWRALVAVPVVLFAFDASWLFPCPCRDSFIYYGYFENGIAYLRRFGDAYYGSRLSVIWPGFLVHHLLPPMAAHLILHLAIYGIAVGSLFSVLRRHVAPSTALVVTLAFAAHPFVSAAMAWDYIDGFGMAYFLASLAAFDRGLAERGHRGWLFLAGAAAVALATANVAYLLLLPAIVALAWSGGWPNCARSLRLTGWAALGGLATLLAFGLSSLAAGGTFLYLSPSLVFARQVLATSNPWRAPDTRWIGHAVWLVLPTCTAVAAIRQLWGTGRTAARRLTFGIRSQVVFLFYFGGMAVLQIWGDRIWFEQYYQVSRLLPLSFLALAGQLEACWVDGSGARGPRFVAVAAALVLVPWLVTLPAPDALSMRGMAAPVLVPLLIGSGQALLRPFGGPRRALAALFCIALSQSFVLARAPARAWPLKLETSLPALYSQLTATIATIEDADPSGSLRLWYGIDGDANGPFYDAVAAAFLLCPRLVNTEFPALAGPHLCDGAPLVAGQTLALLSSRPDAPSLANQALARYGLRFHQLRREEIAGPLSRFAVRFAVVELAPSASSPPDP